MKSFIVLIVVVSSLMIIADAIPNLRRPRRDTETQVPVLIDDITVPGPSGFKPASLGLPIPTQDISGALGLPSPNEIATEGALLPNPSEIIPGSSGFFGSSYARLVEELIGNLMKAAITARDAVTTFQAGLQEEVLKCRNNFLKNINALQARIQGAIDGVSEKLTSSGGAIEQCIGTRRKEASSVLNNTVLRTTNCINERINDAGSLVTGLIDISNNAQEFATGALAEMNKCKEAGNLIAVGTCLGGLALKTEMKGAMFLTQTGLQVARLNIYMATLPASLELCAGSGLVGAGVGTARILMEIGTCSASSVFSTFTGQPNS